MNNILEDAAARLSVDVDALVAGGVARGRRLRRRRQVVGGLGAVAAVAVVAGGAVWAGQSFGSHAGLSIADRPSVSATPDGLPPHAALATADEIKARLSAALPAGLAISGLTVTRAPDQMVLPSGNRPGPDAVHVGFSVNGAVVGISLDWPSAERVALGLSVLPPDSECKGSVPMDPGCRALPDGSWIDTWNERPEGGVGTPKTEVENYVAYWRTDGWRCYASALNSSAEKGNGKVVLPHPPLTVEQLQQIATSDLWFQN